MASTSILWFRHDLRLMDNPALDYAVKNGDSIIPLYIYDDHAERPLGGASKWWLHHSLIALKKELRALGSDLMIMRGKPQNILHHLTHTYDIQHILWNREYTPAAIARDKVIMADLRQKNINVQSFNSHLLWEPWLAKNKMGGFFQVFTPFWKACLHLDSPSQPVAPPKTMPPVSPLPNAGDIDDLKLLSPFWGETFHHYWVPGEHGALKRFDHFLNTAINQYSIQRNRPDVDGTSRLSPHLHFGEISPRYAWHRVMSAFPQDLLKHTHPGAESFLRELGWREFSYHLLYHLPTLPYQSLRQEFDHMPWINDMSALHRWQRGQTGYPIIDAAMAELWHTGWMHNRTRMITASFLIKDTLTDWRHGETWFWDTLVDADLANNVASWQWVAGCGADAAPYFRVFNPVLQGEKFDPQGDYVRRWIPVLGGLPNAYIHQPWSAPADILAKSGVKLGDNYPHRMVDHDMARKRALDIYSTFKQASSDA